MLLLVFCFVKIYQVDNVTSFQRKTIGLALSTIPTLRLPQGGNKDLSEDEFRFHFINTQSVRDNLQTCSSLNGESFNAAIGRLQ
ncbi:hypothetical protein R3W88_024589 [Solanum pinnatisectum]|uniref:Uncharacterized protein n=1 Tax=Solanum pinnatisectum TaxID=50273 RepID=A0AAV9M113_9SOLN|nr:hypothetical protein R3W88_024589 [Solanum pinnatisectum]